MLILAVDTDEPVHSRMSAGIFFGGARWMGPCMADASAPDPFRKPLQGLNVFILMGAIWVKG